MAAIARLTLDIGAAHKEAIKVMSEDAVKATEEELEMVVGGLRTAKAYDREKVKILLHCHHLEDRRNILNSMKQLTDAKVMTGKAPRSGMEEHLEAFLTELGEA